MGDEVRRDVPKPDFLTDEQWEQVLTNSTKRKQMESSERDVETYVRTGGRGDQVFDTMNMGDSTCVLTAIGRKSGREISTALIFLRDGDDVIIVASSGGLPKDPVWWLNLQANPNAWVQIGAERWAVRARQANPEERARLWPRVCEILPLWAHFQKYTERQFPVVILSRR